jgi:predicted nucleic-acid-binding protein
MKILDTNAMLRYILRDNQQMADEVESVLSFEECMIPVEVVAEMVYVLSKVYQIERTSVKDSIDLISNIDDYLFEHQKVVLFALVVFASSKLDFVDCLLIGYAKVEGYELFTFDKKLKSKLSSL